MGGWSSKVSIMDDKFQNITSTNPFKTIEYGQQPDGDLVRRKYDGEAFNTEVSLGASVEYLEIFER